MTVNEEQRQVAIAGELAEDARALAHSTRDVPRPSDSYALLGELTAAQRSLAQVYKQLAAWHGSAVDGTHYAGQDSETDVPATAITQKRLLEAHAAAEAAELVLMEAHSANGRVRWFDSADPDAA